MQYRNPNRPIHNVAPQIHVPSGRGHEQIQVVSLILRETNTYQDQVYRPYMSQIDNDSVEHFQDAMGDAMHLQPGSTAAFANSIVRPAAQDRGIVPIVEGWNSRRFIFMMEITVNRIAGTSESIFLTGFTDFLGADSHGNLADDMRLYFNNCIKVNTITDNMGIGLKQRPIIQNVSQVIFDNPWIQRSYGNNPALVTMRPNDVFGRMQANYFAGEVGDLRNGGGNPEPVKFSSVSNANSSNYISSIMSNLKTAINADSTRSWTETLADAQSGVGELKCRTDVVFKAFRTSTDFNIGKSVCIKDLRDFTPHLDQVTSVVLTGNHREIMSSNNTEHFGGSTYETIICSQLVQAVPALMMKNMIRALNFTAHNNTYDMSWEIIYNDAPQALGRELDLSQHLPVWYRRMCLEVLNSLTPPGYYVPITIRMNCDVVRDTLIYISYDNGPEIPYLNPVFGNALYSPILTNDQRDLELITSDMESLCTSVGLNEDFERGNHHGFNPAL